MRLYGWIAAAVLAATPAFAANMCQTETLSCVTTMPVGGYCECHAKGDVQGGTVIQAGTRGQRPNATAAGCGLRPDAPGCR